MAQLGINFSHDLIMISFCFVHVVLIVCYCKEESYQIRTKCGFEMIAVSTKPILSIIYVYLSYVGCQKHACDHLTRGSYYTSLVAVADLVGVVMMDDIAVDISFDDVVMMQQKMVSDHLDVDQENDASLIVGKYDSEFDKIDFGVVETELQIHILYFPDFQEKMMPAINEIANK